MATEDSLSGSGPFREQTRNRRVDAAIQNEYATRQRVDLIERALADVLLAVDRQDSVLYRGLGGRLRWLVTGR